MSSCTDTTTCFPCEQNSSCDEGCPIENFDACCVQYKGETLPNTPINTGDTLCEILEKLDAVTFTETTFSANSTDSIVGTPNGIKGHSPFYHARLNPIDNAITVDSNGLKVSLSQILQGKVKVNSGDTLDYLENQLSCGSQQDGLGNEIVKVCPQSIGGVIYLVPTINKTNLLNWIKDELCSVVSECIPEVQTTTTSTSTTSTSSTSTTSSSSTSTTTIQPKNFVVNNIAGQGAFTVSLRDEVSSINYTSSSVNNGSVYNVTYQGSTNESEIVVQSGSNVPVGITVTVNGTSVYNNTLYIGSVTIPNILERSDIVVTLFPYAGTTTSSTSTSTTSSTTAATCVTYSITNTTGGPRNISFVTCFGYPTTVSVAGGATVEYCMINGTLSLGNGLTSEFITDECSTTTTSTSTTSTTTLLPCILTQFSNGTGSNTEIFWVPCGETEYTGATLLVGQSLTYCINPNYPPTLNSATSSILSECDTTTTSTSTSTTTSSSTSTSTSSTSSTTSGLFSTFARYIDGGLPADICAESPVAVWISGGTSIATGVFVYTDAGGTIPLAGNYVTDDTGAGDIFNLNGATGEVLTDTGDDCI